MTWLADYRADVERRAAMTRTSALHAILANQGLWALLQYRLASGVHRSRLSPPVKLGLLKALAVWRKFIEMFTEISIPPSARIGPGMLLPHTGTITINGNAVIGRDCIVAHGVTIGSSGRGEKNGTPVIGDHVFIGTNAVVIGKIVVGDHARVAPNSLVIDNVAERTTVMGVPATVYSKSENTQASPATLDVNELDLRQN
jgi:serine O-acetyltransferase